MDRVRRRRFLSVTAAGSVGLVTGCMNGDGEGDGTADGGENATGDGEDGDAMGPDGDGGDADGSGAMSDVRFGGIYGTADEFAFEVQVEGSDRSPTGRYSQGDRYVQFETEQGTAEFYSVGDDDYVVLEDQDMCIMNPGASMTPSEEGQVDTGEYDQTAEDYPDLTPTGTTTIDGVEVYVFELTPEESGQPEPVTYYLAVDTGRLRRVESPSVVVDFHSWGDVEPIEAPDMECRDLSEMPEMPSGSGDFSGGDFGGY